MKIYRDGLEIETFGPASISKNREGHTIEHFKTKNGDLFFVTLKDSFYCAHGKTVAQAISDANWKNPINRPSKELLIQEINSFGKDRLITLNEFRLLTGACLEGCKIALKKAKMEDVESMTVYDIIDKISNEWGNQLLNVLSNEELERK